MRKVEPIKIRENMKVSELVGEMEDMGFGAGAVNRASEIMKKMFLDKECEIFFGVAGAMVPAGMKNIILDMLERTDVFVTTGANLTHDLIEALGDSHYLIDRPFDDSKLNEHGLDRIYNVVMKNEVYEKLENFFEVNWDKFKGCKNIKELIWKIGEILSESTTSPTTAPNLCSLRSQIDKTDNEKNPSIINSEKSRATLERENLNPKMSILQKCYEKKIPVFCPALADSGIGLMIWGRKAAGKEIFIDAFEDMKEIIDFAWTSKKNGIIYVGGGTPKNFIQQSLQFAKGADYGIQITTDRTEPGGSSGAPLQEGVSWGKMKEKADFVDVFCDATIALPLIYGAVKDKIK